MSTKAVELLLTERTKLITERDAALLRFNTEIQELEADISKLSGKKVSEFAAAVPYDDERPDYIKASIEE